MPVLNTADKLYLGGTLVDAAYVGTNKVWPGFSPDKIAGLRVWLDASQLALADGANVPTWTSLADPTQVGNPIAAGSVVPPTFRTNVLNGKPVVRFAPNSGLRWTATRITLAWTIVYVGRMSGPYMVGRVVTASYPPNNLLVGFWNAKEDVCFDNGFTTPDVSVSVTTGWKLYSADATAVPLTRFFKNGVQMGTTNTSVGWGGTLNLNGYNGSGFEEACDCEVAEVCLYDHLLPDAERQQVESYLTKKWGLG